jgi:hypothetical protein
VIFGGGATWNSGVSVPGTKGITIDLGGYTIARGSTTDVLLSVTTHATMPFRLTNGIWTQTVGTGGGNRHTNNVFQIGGGFTNRRFRVDNCTFTSTSGQTIFGCVDQSYGLFDHNTLRAEDNSEMIHNDAWGDAGWDEEHGWDTSVSPGSIDAVYFEDNAFSKYSGTEYGGVSAIQSYCGARTVIRNNTFALCICDQHGNPGYVGARWWEVYDNEWTNAPWAILDLRSGSGYVYGNEATGGSGTPIIQIREEDTGDPANYQIGRGINNGSDPAYFYNNTGTGGAMVISVQAGNIRTPRDYLTTEKIGFTPLTYPHPDIG